MRWAHEPLDVSSKITARLEVVANLKGVPRWRMIHDDGCISMTARRSMALSSFLLSRIVTGSAFFLANLLFSSFHSGELSGSNVLEDPRDVVLLLSHSGCILRWLSFPVHAVVVLARLGLD